MLLPWLRVPPSEPSGRTTYRGPSPCPRAAALSAVGAASWLQPSAPTTTTAHNHVISRRMRPPPGASPRRLRGGRRAWNFVGRSRCQLLERGLSRNSGRRAQPARRRRLRGHDHGSPHLRGAAGPAPRPDCSRLPSPWSRMSAPTWSRRAGWARRASPPSSSSSCPTGATSSGRWAATRWSATPTRRCSSPPARRSGCASQLPGGYAELIVTPGEPLLEELARGEAAEIAPPPALPAPEPETRSAPAARCVLASSPAPRWTGASRPLAAEELVVRLLRTALEVSSRARLPARSSQRLVDRTKTFLSAELGRSLTLSEISRAWAPRRAT